MLLRLSAALRWLCGLFASETNTTLSKALIFYLFVLVTLLSLVDGLEHLAPARYSPHAGYFLHHV